LSEYSSNLFLQYKKHLGTIRFKVLIEAQKLLVPPGVKTLLAFKEYSLLKPVIPLYKLSRLFKLDWLIKSMLFPNQYKKEIKELDLPG
jgi:hypothetical protein